MLQEKQYRTNAEKLGAMKVFIGWDPKEAIAFAVARESCLRYMTLPIPIFALSLEDLEEQKLYRRPYEYRHPAADKAIMWDMISDAPQSTEHANSRFLVPYLAKDGWALFCDGDMLFRSNVARLLDSLDKKYAVYCVKHNHVPSDQQKMDGQVQTKYSRKNWSSFMVFNCNHPSNVVLRDSTELANTLPGRDLHRFCWLEDYEIGELDQSWNYLVGYTDKNVVPKVIHFTEGVPNMPGYENCEYADDWRDALRHWLRGRYY